MDSITIIVSMIVVCLALISLLVMAKPLKVLLGIILNSAIGAVALMASNYVLAPLGVAVGINLLTVGFIGVLGLPGFLALILIQAIL
ncbi:MAG: pro-sigmaK processing inhibitor BofA family protein [Lachnospiraceae bacterium]|nr:pro-sigmaK processing inhibitor BofA family protein [Lachnospiraceae bacterium]